MARLTTALYLGGDAKIDSRGRRTAASLSLSAAF